MTIILNMIIFSWSKWENCLIGARDYFKIRNKFCFILCYHVGFCCCFRGDHNSGHRTSQSERPKQQKTTFNILKFSLAVGRKCVAPKGSFSCKSNSVGLDRYINIRTWLRGLQNKLLNLVMFSLFQVFFWKLWDKGKLKKLQFWTESLGSNYITSL